MSIFSPDAILKSLVTSFGVSPQQVQAALNMLIQELTTLRAERDAFKSGAANMVAHYNARLDHLETQLTRIEALLLTRDGPPPLAHHNGVQHDRD